MFTKIRSRTSKALIGYLILVLGILWAIGSVRNEGQDRRIDLRDSAKIVIIQGCERDNETRAILRGLVLSGVPQTQKLVKEGTLTKAQGDRQIALSKDAVKKLPDLNCKKVGAQFQLEAGK